MDNEKDDSQLSLGFGEASKEKEKEPEVEGTESSNVLEWVCHPAKKNIKVTAIVSIFIVILIVVVYYMTYSIWFSILAFLILFGSLASFYFPTHYRLTDNEIIIKTKAQTQKKSWSQYRTYYPDKNGVLLSPFVRPSRLENFRGLYIKFWFNKDEVVAFVKERIDNIRAQEQETG
jgi:hypothetical protein